MRRQRRRLSDIIVSFASHGQPWGTANKPLNKGLTDPKVYQENKVDDKAKYPKLVKLDSKCFYPFLCQKKG